MKPRRFIPEDVFDTFNALQVGDEEVVEHVITESDLAAFAELTGDENPLHMDDEYAKGTVFGGRVVHGMLTASFISTLIGMRLPGPGALWYEQNLQFKLPVRVGDHIRVVGRVEHKSEAQRAVVLSTNVYTADGRTVIEGTGKVKIAKPKTSKKVMQEKKGAVVVTGAAGGIGRAAAISLAHAGFPVVLNYRSKSGPAMEAVEELEKDGLQAMAVQADVADDEQVRAMMKTAADRFGALEGIVNNAAPPISFCSPEECSWDVVQRHMDVQVKGALNTFQAALPYFLERKYGCIVGISSIMTDNVPPPKTMPYCIAKSALTAMLRSIAAEYGPKGIRANCVSPGLTETEYINEFPEKALMVTKAQTPLRSLATVEDIAGVITFLFSKAARHITGETIRACGGIVMM